MMTTTASTTTVLLLVGLPGAGKSSLARWLCESKTSVVHIEYDQVAESLNEKEELEAWRKSRVVALEKFSKHLEEDPGGLIVMDDNFHLRSMRKTIYRICQDYVLKGNTTVLYGVVFVDTPLDVCLTRNGTRAIESRVPAEVIEKMAITLELPDPTKATWDSSFIRVCGENNLGFQVITDWLVGELPNNPVPPPPQEVNPKELERERQATLESTLQKYDQLMRKWVGQVARIDKRSTGNANKVRKALLLSLRARDSIIAEAVVREFCEEVRMEWGDEKTKLLAEALLESVDGFS
jgi:tRNA uridine 5-carbamoylmethylation protein Kti12